VKRFAGEEAKLVGVTGDQDVRQPRPERPPNIGELLRDPFQVFVDELHEGLTEAGYTDIRPAHGNVFAYLRGEGSRITELAERAQLTKQTMGYLVDYLEERGYVERKPDPGDKRAKIIHLTDEGREAFRVALEVISGIEARWTELLGRERMELLRELLKELKALTEKLTRLQTNPGRAAK
jgi:DNA-binding MarR family transcriptional regulator